MLKFGASFLLLGFAFGAMWLFTQTAMVGGVAVPLLVKSKYDKMLNNGRYSCGVELSVCKDASDSFYIVSGSWCIGDVSHNYNRFGLRFSSHHTGDVAGQNPPYPIDLDAYTCTTLAQETRDN